jgi:uncharacterized protein YijF (DUF1287 family)
MRRALNRTALLILVAAMMATLSAASLQIHSTESSAHHEFLQRLADAAVERTHHSVRYDPSYVRIPYPGGDVAANTGVCTDEVIRAYRALGIDLQKEVHQDMVKNYPAYPGKRAWMPSQPDTSIDHRRVPNLMVFFSRKGEALAITARGEDYSPGDLVTWDLGGGVPHIGIVTAHKSEQTGRYMAVHNIGRGPMLEDVLLNWRITGHYRYFGPNP